MLILFDLDGTLIDDSGLPDAFRATCARIGALTGVPTDDLVVANSAAWQEAWPEVEDEYLVGEDAGRSIVEDAWRGTLQRCGILDAGVLAAAVDAWAEEERRSFRLYPDVLPALDRLRSVHARIGMVTNGASAVQRTKLEATGLIDAFDPLVISSEAGVRKPDPAIFEHALALAGATAAETWFVGDNLWHDVQAAKDSGLRAAWIDREGAGLDPGWPRPDRVLRSLVDLAQDPR